MQTKKYSLLISLFLFLFFLFLYFFKSSSSFIINTDFTRDLYDILKISQGNLTLIGPYLSFGYYTGPFYYYLFAPLFFLTNFSVSSIFFLNALLFSFSLSFFFFIISSRHRLLPSLLSTIIIGLSPFFLTTARHPGNGFTYISLLLLFLTLSYLHPPKNKFPFLFLGLLAGIIINFHPASLLVILPLSLHLFTHSKTKKQTTFYFLGILLSFLPLLLFEIKNSFVITQGFFHHPQRLQTFSFSLLPRLTFLLRSFFPFHLILPLLSLFIYFFPPFSSSKTKPFLKIFLLPLSSLLLYLFLPLSKLEFHYLLPLFLSLSFFSLIFLLQILKIKRKYFSLFLLFPFIISLFLFPSSSYQPSSQTLDHFQQATNYVLQHHLIPNNQSFNLIAINGPQHLTPVGHGYRYFFLLNHHPPLGPNQYSQSEHLLIFSTDPHFTPDSLNSWETNQFGQHHLQYFKKHSLENLDIYHISSLQP